MVRIYPLVRGLASYVLPKSIFIRPGSGGTFSAEYCYSVWLRHYKLLWANGLITNQNQLERVAEIGPGDSLGIGMAALFTGAKNYYAFDLIRHANLEKNLRIAQELLTFFKSGAEIPNTTRQRFTAPTLDNYSFPSQLASIDELTYQKRYEAICNALKEIATDNKEQVSISYQVPWLENHREMPSEIDLIFSQAVMEHVEPIEPAYQRMFDYLKSGGILSHQIDFKTHEMTKEWNGHWFIDNHMWTILAHGRKYPMNRLPLSAHLAAMQKVGFEVKTILPVKKENSFQGNTPQVPGVKFTQEDLVVSGALIQAIKP